MHTTSISPPLYTLNPRFIYLYVYISLPGTARHLVLQSIYVRMAHRTPSPASSCVGGGRCRQRRWSVVRLCTYTQTYTLTHTYIHAHLHTNTYIHAYIHRYIHTYIHTHIHTRMYTSFEYTCRTLLRVVRAIMGQDVCKKEISVVHTCTYTHTYFFNRALLR